jgi:DNA-binding transcriptional LysR family regulator
MAIRIELRHVEAFLALARALHFSRAARALNVSQPALSRTIGTLEDSIGVPLFVRTTRQVDLTEAGRAFMLSAPSILEALQKSVADARRAAAGETGRLAVGYMDFAINGPLPSLLQQFRKTAPGIAVDLSYMPTNAQREALFDGRLDIGFMIGPLAAEGVTTQAVDDAALVALLPRTHRLARRQTITIDQLAREAWVLGAADPWQAFRTIVFDCCAKHGFAPNVVQEATNSDGVFGLVAAGVGVSLYSDSAANLRRKGIVVKEVTASPRILTIAAWRTDNANPARARFVASVLGEKGSSRAPD